MSARALGLLAGYLADRRWGDPARHHPVAAFGKLAARLEEPMWDDDRGRGTAYAAILVGGTALAAAAVDRATAQHPIARFAVTAGATWAVLGGRSLGREAEAVRALLDDVDLDPARQRLTHLVGRDTSALDAPDITRAVVESVAENTSDAVVAPLLAGAVAGVPGLVAYRAANTLDAMVGHRSDRYRNFGWAAARLDDILNWIPARVSAALTILLSPLVGGRPTAAQQAWQRDAGHHPSPNAGPVEAAFAGALGVQLGGVNTYGGETEDRHTLGDGRTPIPTDIDRSVRLSSLIGHAAAALAVVVATARAPKRRQQQRQ